MNGPLRCSFVTTEISFINVEKLSAPIPRVEQPHPPCQQQDEIWLTAFYLANGIYMA